MTGRTPQSVQASGASPAQAPEPSFPSLFSTLHRLMEELERQVGDLAGCVRRDIEELARVIEDTRNELRELGPEELRRHHLAVANGELDAVARHLEEATNEILDSCDALERLVDELPEDRREPFVEQITRIYEACSFHDISGQRIRKVVNALDEVERRLDRLREAYGSGRLASAGGGRNADAAAPADEGEARLCNGPALPGEGTSQEEVDALLGFGRDSGG